MAILHQWSFSNATITADKCSIDSTDFWDQQSASNAGTRNSGGTTASSTSPTRATGANSIGGLNFARLRTLTGDDYISGSGTGYRCDLLLQGAGSYSSHEGDLRVYRLKTLMQKNTDFFPVAGSNWNTAGMEFHHNLGGWPGGVGISHEYCGTDPAAPFNQANITGAKIQVGDLYFDFFGGTVPTANFSPTPNTICYEKFPFLKAGTWEGKVIDLACKIQWNSNFAEASGTSYYYKDVHGGTGTPTNFASSGWIEVQYRLGTISGGTVNWGAWTWYDPGTMTFAGGGKQVWVNGSSPSRHYRPMIFRALDTGVDTTAYLKLANYNVGGSADSSIYVADPVIAQDWPDIGLSLPSGGGGGGGGGGGTVFNAPGLAHIGISTVDTSVAVPLADDTNQKRGNAFVVPSDAGTISVGYEYGSLVFPATSTVRKQAVYDTTANPAGVLLGVSDAATFTNTTDQWVQYTYSTPVDVSGLHAQNIVIATITGDSNKWQTWKTTAAGAEFLRIDVYGTGPSNPWLASVGGGFTGTYNNQLAICVAYNQSGGGGGGTAPTPMSATCDNNSLTLHCDIALDTASIPEASAFKVSLNGAAGVQPTDKLVSATNPQDLNMQLPFQPAPTDVVVLSYTAPALRPLRDAGGTHNVLTFTNFAVTNNASPPLRTAGGRVAGSRTSNPGNRLSLGGGGL